MNHQHFRTLGCVPLVLMAAMAGPSRLVAQDQPTYKVLYTFSGGTDGSLPIILAGDGKGNFYGMTKSGGDLACSNYLGAGCGVVFKVDANGHETVKWAFTGGSDGSCQACINLVLDNKGNIYGGSFGGATGAGLVFKIDPSNHLTPLYNFTGGADGYGEYAITIIRDDEGNIYGTTDLGGDLSCNPDGCGVVFKLEPNGKETVLHSFTGGNDGYYPYSALVRDEAGNLFSTTFSGGANGAGVVYKVDPKGDESDLYTFTSSSTGSSAPLLLENGELYGTTPGAGQVSPPGVVFKLNGDGDYTVVYAFTGGADGGGTSDGRLVQDKAGNLYGMTQAGGNLACPLNPESYWGGGPGGGCGVVFKLDTSGRETVLYTFCSQTNCADGALPQPGNLVIEEEEGEVDLVESAASGESAANEERRKSSIRLYGTTGEGGSSSGVCALYGGCGVVFELTVPKEDR